MTGDMLTGPEIYKRRLVLRAGGSVDESDNRSGARPGVVALLAARCPPRPQLPAAGTAASRAWV
jgi:hypothetical protein